MTNPEVSETSGFEIYSSHTILLDGARSLTCVAIESMGRYADGLPSDWRERLDEEITAATVIVPEYFPPELEATSHNTRLLGGMSVRYSTKNHIVYDHVAEAAAAAEKPVAVVDPANRPSFLLYNSVLPVAAMHVVGFVRDKGVSGREPDLLERIVPSGTDARRMISAAGIRQVSAVLPENGKALYIAAPAHVRRVLGNLTIEHDALDRMRYAAYKKAMAKYMHVRTYQHGQIDGWRLIDTTAIE